MIGGIDNRERAPHVQAFIVIAVVNSEFRLALCNRLVWVKAFLEGRGWLTELNIEFRYTSLFPIGHVLCNLNLPCELFIGERRNWELL